MKIRTEPLLGSAMFAILITLMASVIGTISSMQTMNTVFSMPLNDPTFDPTTSAEFTELFEGLMFSSGIMSLLNCLLWLVGGIGAGVIYTILHNRQERLQSGAPRGGAAAGALGFLISTVFGGLIQLIFTNQVMGGFMNELSGTAGVPVEFSTLMIGFGIIGAVCGGVFMAGVGGLLGALGGLLGGMFIGPKGSGETAVS